MEHNIEVDIADFVAALTCFHRLSGKMYQIKMCSNITTGSCSTSQTTAVINRVLSSVSCC